MVKKIAIILILTTSMQVKAQLIKKKSINASIGYGLCSPTSDDVDVMGKGLYLQGEYVLTFAKWIDIRPYAGLVFTKTEDNPDEYKSATNAFLIGGKTRIKAPIPWVAPYVEIGIGASIGSFETLTTYENIEQRGLIVHIPYSIGLEFGRKHIYNFAFTYYYQKSVKQYTGAVLIGVTIPLKNSN